MGIDVLAGLSAGPVRVRGRRARILVFDSGLGGLTVAAALRTTASGAELIYLADDAVFPYGALADDVLIDRVSDIVGAAAFRERADLVIIACNTASTLVLPMLRAQLPVPVVGTVPAIKPAVALTKTGRVAVLATAGTIRRTYTAELVERFAEGCRVDLVAAPGLATLAERKLRGDLLPAGAVAEQVAPCFSDNGGPQTDVVVLACTHFPLLLDELAAAAPPDVRFVDPAPAIARRAASLIDAAPLPPGQAFPPDRALFTSGLTGDALARVLALRGFSTK